MSATQGVVTRAAIKQVARGTAFEHIGGGSARHNSGSPLIELLSDPYGAIGKGHLTHPMLLTFKPPINGDGVHSVDMLDDELVIDPHHLQVVGDDARSQPDLTAAADGDIQGVIDNEIVTITDVEQVEVGATAPLQGVVTLTAFQSQGARAFTQQQIIARPPHQGVITTTPGQGVIAITPCQGIVTRTPDQHVIARGANEDPLAEGQHLGGAPTHAAGKLHPAELGTCAGEPALDHHCVNPVAVGQAHVVTIAHDADVFHGDPRPEVHLTVRRHMNPRGIVDDEIASIAHIEAIDIVAGAPFEGVIASTALEDNDAFPAAGDQIVAVAALEGVIPTAANEGVIAGTGIDQLIGSAAGQRIVTGAANGNSAAPLVNQQAAPDTAIGKHDLGHPVHLTEEPVFNQDGILTVDMLELHIVASTDHLDVRRDNTGAEDDGAVMLTTGLAVDNEIVTIAEIKAIGIGVTATDQGIVAFPPFQHAGTAATGQQVIASAALEGIVTTATHQGIVTGTAIEQFIADAALDVVIAGRPGGLLGTGQYLLCTPISAICENNTPCPNVLCSNSIFYRDAIMSILVHQD